MADPKTLKSVIAPYCTAMADYDPKTIQSVLGDVFAQDAHLQLCHPQIRPLRGGVILS